MFAIRDRPLDAAALRAALAGHDAGGLVVFEGWVRRRNEGREVVSLAYEAYVPMAEREGAAILAEARQRFAILAAVAEHRVGVLPLGEIAVWVGVTAEHRDAAFQACRFVIDEIKERLPVWKKEQYADGTSDWVLCRHDHH